MNSRPLEFLLLLFAGWVNRRQLAVIDYLKEENRILCVQMQGRRLQFTDDQRRRLAIRGKALGRRMLQDVTRLLTPDTILRWYQIKRSSPPNTTAAANAVPAGRRRYVRFKSSS
jgi:hypothetical protein